MIIDYSEVEISLIAPCYKVRRRKKLKVQLQVAVRLREKALRKEM
jgi:hypothetical protein